MAIPISINQHQPVKQSNYLHNLVKKGPTQTSKIVSAEIRVQTSFKVELLKLYENLLQHDLILKEICIKVQSIYKHASH